MRLTKALVHWGALLVLACAACGGSGAADDGAVSDDTSAELVLTDLELDLSVLEGFPSRARESANALGERDAEIGSWSLHYVRTKDGFEGLLAYGAEANGETRYIMALDAKNKAMLLLDGVGQERAAEARSAEEGGAGAQATFAAETFDAVTSSWLRSELDRMLDTLGTELDAVEAGASTASVHVRALSATQICALRLAIYAGASIIPFTKLPLIGRGASLTGQFVGSFVIDAVGTAAIGQLTESAKSAAASAASGIALESVLRQGAKLVRSVGASGAGAAAGFVVGAVLGSDGDYVLLPGDKLEKTATETAIRHADGSRTVIPTTGAARFLPASCRQALAENRH